MKNTLKTDMETRDPCKPDAFATGNGLLHPAVLILVWISVTLMAQMLNAGALILLAGSLMSLALCTNTLQFLTLLRRTRWILFSLFVIYAYAGDGTPLWTSLGVFSPITEGVLDGSVQLLRLLAVLAGLSVLLRLLTQSQFVAGLYGLLRPLDLIGVSRARIAVRLALTLHYAEGAPLHKKLAWTARVEELLAPTSQAPGEIALQSAALTLYDGLVIAAVLLVVAGVWL